MELYWQALLAVCVAVLFKFMCSNPPQMRILQVYSVPGKWYYFKYVVVVVFLSIRKFFAKFSSKNNLKGYGIRSHNSEEEMDKKQPLSNDPKAFDAVYMNGSNRIGWHVIVGMARRPHNVDGFLILKVPGVGVLLSPRLPDTKLPPAQEEDSSFSTEGLSLTPVQPMKSWLLQYKGKMRLAEHPHKKVHVTLEAMWESDLAVFNYDTDVLAANLAKAMSSEMWSRSYFHCLKHHHQTHYEQFGDLVGNVVIDDYDFNLNVSALRDHSFGVRREWKAFHRYVLHIFTLADGSRGNAGVVCIPSMFSRLEIGYVYGLDGALYAVTDMDFDLYQHGEKGEPPTDYGFTFMAGKAYYEVKVHVEERTELFLGLDWKARIVETPCRYSINGVEGWGVVEWMYANHGGRPHNNL